MSLAEQVRTVESGPLASLSYAKPLQHESELEQLIALFQRERVRSYLEIGARYGGSFERIMMELPQGSRGVAVDFPGGPFGDDNSAPILLAALSRLKRLGRDVSCVFGPSSAPEVVGRVGSRAPFDAILIDGDHSYEGVKRDFETYSPLARIVVLHDIAAPEGLTSKDGLPLEVPRFWAEIKQSFRYREIITPNSLMGIGVLFNRD